MTYDWPECRKKFAKITPINNVYWSHFRIDRVKMLIVNLKSLELSRTLERECVRTL
jgi:hypothetical protein